MNLNEKAMLVRLSISQWTARKVDRKITDEVDEKYQSHDAGRYNKLLIAKDALKEIEHIVGAARTFHYQNTLPWLDDGSRILPTGNFFDYTKKMREYKSSYENAVSRFKKEYETYVTEAERRLNGMFNDDDYPTLSELDAKYGFDTAIYPIPDAGDFRVQLSEEEVEEIRKDITESADTAHKLAMDDLWGRLTSAVTAVRDKLSDPEAIFRDSLIENLVTLAGLAVKLNYGADPKINAACLAIAANLCHSPELLRTDMVLRKQTVDAAESLLGVMG